MLVSGQDFSDEVIGRIQASGADSTVSRRGLSLRVCEWLNWKSPNGKFKEMSCRVALSKLERRGIVELPAPHAVAPDKFRGGGRAPSTEPIHPVRCSLGQLGGVELVRIDSRRTKDSKTWNALMESYHYLGAGPLCGAQMRYLIKSPDHGWLGGLAFSAAAWRLAPRDGWIGWSEAARREHLSEVVCNSRFLILPQVEVPNLASHVLSLAVGRLAQDWRARYGLCPVLLETFVERDRFRGTCYRAAGWQHLGLTRGRGRQDRDREGALPVKDIYVYPLAPNFRETLNGSSRQVGTGTAVVKLARKSSRPVGTAEDWPEEEFGQTDLGDQRRTHRLVTIVGDFYARPQGNIPQVCQSRAKTKATYRFFGHPEITMDKILHSHYEATLERLKEEKIVLAVQDTTTLNYTTHSATEDLGPIGNRLDKGTGLIVHDTMAFNPDGIPLGLMDVQCWARDPADFGKKRRRNELPIDQKESRQWLVSFRKVAEAQKRYPGTTFVSVGDREADIYELFELALADKSSPKLLVRAIHDRLLVEGQGHLWEKVARQEVSGIQEINVPRQGSRPARVAQLEVRFAQVNLKAPVSKSGLRDLTISAVLAREVNPPDGVKSLEWMLLTTVPVTSFGQAVERVAWYTVRWKIEVFHKTLKSGCKIEERQFGSADRIETCLAIDMVVAWRIFYLTILGRKTPDVPCSVFFEEAEWKALVAYIKQNPIPPDKPPTLREATRMVATLGGFLGRKGDGEPGVKTMWIGLQCLDYMTAMYKVMTGTNVPHFKKCTVSSNPEYG